MHSLVILYILNVSNLIDSVCCLEKFVMKILFLLQSYKSQFTKELWSIQLFSKWVSKFHYIPFRIPLSIYYINILKWEIKAVFCEILKIPFKRERSISEGLKKSILNSHLLNKSSKILLLLLTLAFRNGLHSIKINLTTTQTHIGCPRTSCSQMTWFY